MDILMRENIGGIKAQAGSIRIRAGTQRRDYSGWWLSLERQLLFCAVILSGGFAESKNL
jgi:hypothetical protein